MSLVGKWTLYLDARSPALAHSKILPLGLHPLAPDHAKGLVRSAGLRQCNFEFETVVAGEKGEALRVQAVAGKDPQAQRCGDFV